MPSSPQSRYNLLVDLLDIPSITASSQEDQAASFIYDWLAGIEWFKKHPEFLTLLPTPLEGDRRPLHAVTALVMAAKTTRRTIILTGHFDVVDTAVYGDLRDVALKPDALAARLAAGHLDSSAAADLASGKYMFGRGSMDMKCGVAVEMALLRDFAEDRSLFDVNLLLVLVPDEENVSAGMRGAIPWLLRLQRDPGLEYLAAINAEPTEAGRPAASAPTLFFGTVGKLMPAFLCIGRESHVGAYYEGLSAALLSARILLLAEGNPELGDPAGGECCPSWICLEHRVLAEGYSVTVPGAAIAYFNCYATHNSPAAVLAQMRNVAAQAASETLAQLDRSRTAMLGLGLEAKVAPRWHIRIFSVEELRIAAADRLGEGALAERLAKFWLELKEADPREAAIATMRELVRLSGVEGPLVVIGFLPPFYPPRSNFAAAAANDPLQRAADTVIREARRMFGITVEKAPFFTGLCDLSYFGFQGTPEDLDVLAANMPGWGKIYSIPMAELTQLDVPVINFGPSGRDPHKRTERLETCYSLEQYPVLLDILVRAIGQEDPCVNGPASGNARWRKLPD